MSKSISYIVSSNGTLTCFHICDAAFADGTLLPNAAAPTIAAVVDCVMNDLRSDVSGDSDDMVIFKVADFWNVAFGTGANALHDDDICKKISIFDDIFMVTSI